MRILRNGAVIVVLGALLSFGLVGCKTTDAHGDAGLAKHEVKCKACYEKMVQVRKTWGKTATVRTKMVSRCPDCKVDMSVYEQDGKAMMSCPKCAPGGVACDQCCPPKPKS